jgi:hypothetical protein
MVASSWAETHEATTATVELAQRHVLAPVDVVDEGPMFPPRDLETPDRVLGEGAFDLVEASGVLVRYPGADRLHHPGKHPGVDCLGRPPDGVGLVGGRVQQRQQQGELVGGGALPLVDHLRPSLGEHITVGHQHFSQVGDAQTRPPTGRPTGCCTRPH